MSASWVVKTPADVLGRLNDCEQRHAPKQLYLMGDLSLLERSPRVSVVGSRKASDAGLSRARSLARALVHHNMVVVSGLAEGIDTAAHESAITAGGRTIAVLGTPVDQYYPKQNEALQQLIAREHLLVSQFAPDSAVTPKSFPIRNRTMALLTDATVIVEAGEKSGTVHQGWEALRLGRKLFLMENVLREGSSVWAREMIDYGAEVLSRSNLDDALADLPAVTLTHAATFAELA